MTICWECANSVPNKTRGCEWSRHLKPVKGWTAAWHYKKSAGDDFLTADVQKCPEFKPIKKEQEPPEYYDDSVRAFAIAVMRFRAKQYCDGAYESYESGERDPQLISAAHFFASDYGALFSALAGVNTDWVVQASRQRARNLHKQPAISNEQIRKILRIRKMPMDKLSEALYRNRGYIGSVLRGEKKNVTRKERKIIAEALELSDEMIAYLKRNEVKEDKI